MAETTFWQTTSAKTDFRNDEVHKDFIQGPMMRAQDLRLWA